MQTRQQLLNEAETNRMYARACYQSYERTGRASALNQAIQQEQAAARKEEAAYALPFVMRDLLKNPSTAYKRITGAGVIELEPPAQDGPPELCGNACMGRSDHFADNCNRPKGHEGYCSWVELKPVTSSPVAPGRSGDSIKALAEQYREAPTD